MKIHTENCGGVVILTLNGELDTRGNQILDQTLKKLTQEQCYKIVLDLASIRFIGSKTIALLLSNMKEIRAGGGDIKLLNTQRGLLQYLKQQRIFEIFDTFSSRSEALRAFPPTPAPAPAADPNGAVPSFAQNSEAMNPFKDLASGQFQTGEVLYANSCILAALIKTLEEKGMLTSKEVRELTDYESLSLKGVIE